MPGNLQSIPASVIASWPEPNYVDPITRSWMPSYAGVLQAIMTLMLSTRLVLRSMGKAGGLGLDDALLVPAFLGATMFTVLIIIGAEQYGIDRHIWDVVPTKFEYTALVGWLAEIAFVVSTCCTKVSVLLFFRRLTEGTINKAWKIATIAAIAFTVAYGIVFVLILLLNCQPLDAYWNSYRLDYTAEYHCTDTTILNPLQGALSIVTDFFSVVLPVSMLWQLEATKQQKWALNGIFSLGLLVVVAGIVRTYYLERLGTHWDITWLGFDVFVWSELEVQLAIICASAPALRVFFRRYLSNSITRALNSARSTAERSAARESKQMDTMAIMNDRGDVQGIRQSKQLGVNVSMESSRELEAGSVSPSSYLNEHSVKTPADYENIALDTLQIQRKSQAFGDWHRPRRG